MEAAAHLRRPSIGTDNVGACLAYSGALISSGSGSNGSGRGPWTKMRLKPRHSSTELKNAAMEIQSAWRHHKRSHRYTGDLSIESMLKDIGPGLWISINPAYAPIKSSSSSHRVHFFDKKKGWAEKVDKTHHLKMDDFMAHADKCLQLGEKPFTSGGMKLGK